eukprot:6871775-Karenia_brevis.AAC.1
MEPWHEIKVRAIVGPDAWDDNEVTPKHRRIIVECFDFDERSKVSGVNGDKQEKMEDWELE